MAYNGSRYRVLYFISDMCPTEEQQLQASQFGPHCSFRNATYIDPKGSLEDCDAVAGDVPEGYAANFAAAVPYVDFVNGKFTRKLAIDPDTEAPAEPVDGPDASEAPDQPGDPFLGAPAARSRRTTGRAPTANWTPQG